MLGPKFTKVVYFNSMVNLNPWTEVSVSFPCARSVLDLNYCTCWITLILVHGLKIKHGFEINHLCEFGPWSFELLYIPMRDKSAARIGLAARFHEFFPYRFAHILRPNLWRPGVRLQSYITFSTCMSARKLLKFVILCTNPMQIGILEVIQVIHITDYFYF